MQSINEIHSYLRVIIRVNPMIEYSILLSLLNSEAIINMTTANANNHVSISQVRALNINTMF